MDEMVIDNKVDPNHVQYILQRCVLLSKDHLKKNINMMNNETEKMLIDFVIPIGTTIRMVISSRLPMLMSFHFLTQ